MLNRSETGCALQRMTFYLVQIERERVADWLVQEAKRGVCVSIKNVWIKDKLMFLNVSMHTLFPQPRVASTWPARTPGDATTGAGQRDGVDGA